LRQTLRSSYDGLCTKSTTNGGWLTARYCGVLSAFFQHWLAFADASVGEGRFIIFRAHHDKRLRTLTQAKRQFSGGRSRRQAPRAPVAGELHSKLSNLPKSAGQPTGVAGAERTRGETGSAVVKVQANFSAVCLQPAFVLKCF